MRARRVGSGVRVWTFGGTTPRRWASQFSTTETSPDAPRLWPRAPLCEYRLGTVASGREARLDRGQFHRVVGDGAGAVGVDEVYRAGRRLPGESRRRRTCVGVAAGEVRGVAAEREAFEVDCGIGGVGRVRPAVSSVSRGSTARAGPPPPPRS